MSALDDMRASLVTSLYGALGKPYGVTPQAVAVAVDRALSGSDWDGLLSGFVAADAAAQAYKLAYAGTPPAALATYAATWTAVRDDQHPIVLGEREAV